MIWTALLAARSFLAKIPWQVWAVAAVLLSAWLWGNHRYDQGVDDVEAKYAAARAQAVAQARKADGVARDTVDREQALSGAEIERGREAAAVADDPWRAATEAMKGARP